MENNYFDYVKVLKKVRLLLDNKSTLFGNGLCSFVGFNDLSACEHQLFRKIIYENPTPYFKKYGIYFFKPGNIVVRKSYLTKLIHKYERM